MPSSQHLPRSQSITSVADTSDRDSIKSSPARQRHAHGVQFKHGRRRSSSRFRSPSPNYDNRARHTYSRREATPEDHTDCNQRYERLEQKYGSLKAKYAELNTAHITLTKVHESLHHAIGVHVANGSPSSSASTTSTPSDSTFTIPEKYQDINRQNATTRFPLIKFWTRDAFQIFIKKQKQDDVLNSTKGKPRRGNARLKEGENVACQYLEEDDGSIVDGHVAEAIRKHLQLIFKELGTRLPEKWGGIGIVDRAYVHEELYKKYPYLLLCHDDWKADYLAGRGLSAFRSTEKRRTVRAGATVKAEVEDQDQDDLPLTDEKTGIKRKASTPEPGEAVEPKKPRLTQGSSSPSSSSKLSEAAPLEINTEESHSHPTPSPPLEAMPTPSNGFHTSHSPAPTSSPAHDITVAISSVSAPSKIADSSDIPQTTASALSPAQADLVSAAMASKTVANLSATSEPAPGSTPLEPRSRSVEMKSVSPSPPTALGTTASAPMISNEHMVLNTGLKRPIINPISKLFGPAIAPSARFDSLREAQATQDLLKSKLSAKKELPSASTSAEAEGPSKGSNMSTCPAGESSKFKKVTASNSAKNLCYQEYLKDNAPLTPADFEKYWKGLPRETTKRWNEKSKSKKSPNEADAGADE